MSPIIIKKTEKEKIIKFCTHIIKIDNKGKFISCNMPAVQQVEITAFNCIEYKCVMHKLSNNLIPSDYKLSSI